METAYDIRNRIQDVRNVLGAFHAGCTAAETKLVVQELLVPSGSDEVVAGLLLQALHDSDWFAVSNLAARLWFNDAPATLMPTALQSLERAAGDKA